MQVLKRNPLTHSPLLWLMLLAVLWACLGAQTLGLKTASGQIYGQQSASWESTPLQAAPRLGLRALEEISVSAPPVGKAVANLRLEYEQASRNLGNQTNQMLATGASEEQVARWAVQQRNQLKTQYRDLTPPDEVAKYEARNMTTYGNTLGPTADQLSKQGYSWQQIIEKSSRAGGGDLDFAPPGFGLSK